MKKKMAILCGICVGTMLMGCGAKTTSEIIMPDEPMTSSVAEESTASDAQTNDTAKSDTASKTTTPETVILSI